MGFNLCTVILVIAHGVVSAVAFGIAGYFSFTSISQFANQTKYGILELPQELQEASAIVETIVLWGFIQAPGIVLLCKGKFFRGLGFFFLLICEGLFIVVPILAQLGYAVANNASLADVANLLYTNFAFFVLTIIIAILETFTLCCCGASE